ncbi:MAG TPA: hypothetical protein PLD59_09065, partial [Tepidisphaeraceae bacterium]|nr:hypothetical protein [Tepidisphaeraceae bacterium]
MSAKSWRLWIAVIILVALTARMTAVFALKRWDASMPGVNRQLAVSLNESGTFTFREHGTVGPSSVTTPVYPVLLAAIFRTFGSETPTAYFAAITLNAIFGALTAGVVATWVRRAGSLGHFRPTAEAPRQPGPRIERLAIAAGLVVALWPPQIFAATFAQPLALTVLCITSACLLWARAITDHGLLTWLGCCIALSIAALIEPPFVAAVGFAGMITLMMRAWPLDVRVRNVAVLALVSILTLLPWISRNLAVHGRALFTTTLWQHVWAGANPHATGSDRLPLTPDRRAAAGSGWSHDDSDAEFARVPMMQIDLIAPAGRAALREQPEVAREAIFRGWASDWLGEHRSTWIAQLPTRIGKWWWIDYDHPMSRNPLALIPRTLAAAGALVALPLLLRRRAGFALPAVVLAAMFVAASLTIATAKMTILIEPLQLGLIFSAMLVLIGLREPAGATTPQSRHLSAGHA